MHACCPCACARSWLAPMHAAAVHPVDMYARVRFFCRCMVLYGAAKRSQSLPAVTDALSFFDVVLVAVLCAVCVCCVCVLMSKCCVNLRCLHQQHHTQFNLLCVSYSHSRVVLGGGVLWCGAGVLVCCLLLCWCTPRVSAATTQRHASSCTCAYHPHIMRH